jgi:hypothetical protein
MYENYVNRRQGFPKYSFVRFEVFTAVAMRMPSSGMLRRVPLVRTDVSKERSAFIIRVKRIGDLGTLAVTSYLAI